MDDTFCLEILTVDKQFFVGQAESLIMPIQDGKYGVMSGHESTVTAIVPGELQFKADGEWHTAVVSDGFAEITPEYAVVLVSSAERPEEIDVKRAEAAKELAEERLRNKQSVIEYYNTSAALARAMARLQAHRKR